MPASPASAADVKLDAARALWQRNEVAGAEAILREAHGNEPAREDTATLLAEVLRSQGRLSAASQVLHDACRANAFEATLCVRAARFAPSQPIRRGVIAIFSATVICGKRPTP